MATDNNSYPISSGSRTKLNAFRYQEEEIGSDQTTSKDRAKPVHGNKENQSSWLNGVVEPMHVSPSNDHTTTEASSTEPRPVKECPQTPGNRIPLADLISNAEDSFDPAPGPEVTPVDHVVWQHIPASSNPDASTQTPGGGRRKRRRHSSSPTESPSHGIAKKTKEPLDLQSIQALFKTPQHDLAAELWNNYMDKNVGGGADDLPPTRLANLLSSSPQTPISGRTSRDSSGLRRSISCAAEWPTSRAKRRRFHRQEPGPGRGIFSRTSSNVLDSGRKQPSRINVLLETIEKSLHPPQTSDMGPPGSSPLRQRVDAQRCRSSSPIIDRKGLGATGMQQSHSIPPNDNNRRATKNTDFGDDSSEFGDDDLDQDLMDLADVSTDPFVDSTVNRTEFDSFGSSAWSSFAAEKQPIHPEQPIMNSKPPTVNKLMNNDTKPDDSDDFDDEYGDFDNIQDILAECDEKQEHSDPSKSGSVQQPVLENANGSAAADSTQRKPSNLPTQKSGAASSDDEFDDDFDLDAIEQTMKQAGQDEDHVCFS